MAKTLDDQLYRKMVQQLGALSQTLQQELSIDQKKYPGMEMDRQMIFYKIREINGYLRDMKEIIDVHEGPEKITAEYTRKKGEIDGGPKLIS